MTTRSIRGAAALTRAAAAGGAAAAGASQHRLLRAALRNPRAGTSSPWLSEVLTGPRWPSIPSVANGAAGARLVSSAAAAATSAAREEGSRGARFLAGDVVLYQYEACPFCNKVKAFLDYYKIPYKVVEVNPISKKEIKWSDYKKVPILMVDGKQMNDSSAIIDQLFGKIHPDDLVENEEERKWRGWVDDHLVHVLSPNIYRTPSEALESFDYITTHGNFSFMERLIAKYSGAAAMYMVSKKLKKRHNITDERAALYEAAETWVDALKGRPFCGGAEPNLADLAVFGVLRPIRHLQSGKDMVEHTRIGEWYDRMQHAVGNSTRAMSQSWQESREKI